MQAADRQALGGRRLARWGLLLIAWLATVPLCAGEPPYAEALTPLPGAQGVAYDRYLRAVAKRILAAPDGILRE